MISSNGSGVGRRLAVGGSVLAACAMLAAASMVWAESQLQDKGGFRELQLGFIALEKGDFEAALGHYERAREIAVGNDEKFNAVFGIGSVALQLNRLGRARGAFEEAHSLRPEEAAATFMLGMTCRRQGELKTALIYLAEASVRDPDLTQAGIELGLVYAALERHADAERVCREVLKKDPGNIEAQLGVAVALYHQDEYAAAVAQYRSILEGDPENLRAHYGLGLALVFAGDRKAAIAEVAYLNSRDSELADELYEWVFQGN